MALQNLRSKGRREEPLHPRRSGVYGDTLPIRLIVGGRTKRQIFAIPGVNFACSLKKGIQCVTFRGSTLKYAYYTLLILAKTTSAIEYAVIP